MGIGRMIGAGGAAAPPAAAKSKNVYGFIQEKFGGDSTGLQIKGVFANDGKVPNIKMISENPMKAQMVINWEVTKDGTKHNFEETITITLKNPPKSELNKLTMITLVAKAYRKSFAIDPDSSIADINRKVAEGAKVLQTSAKLPSMSDIMNGHNGEIKFTNLGSTYDVLKNTKYVGSTRPGDNKYFLAADYLRDSGYVDDRHLDEEKAKPDPDPDLDKKRADSVSAGVGDKIERFVSGAGNVAGKVRDAGKEVGGGVVNAGRVVGGKVASGVGKVLINAGRVVLGCASKVFGNLFSRSDSDIDVRDGNRDSSDSSLSPDDNPHAMNWEKFRKRTVSEPEPSGAGVSSGSGHSILPEEEDSATTDSVRSSRSSLSISNGLDLEELNELLNGAPLAGVPVGGPDARPRSGSVLPNDLESLFSVTDTEAHVQTEAQAATPLDEGPTEAASGSAAAPPRTDSPNQARLAATGNTVKPPAPPPRHINELFDTNGNFIEGSIKEIYQDTRADFDARLLRLNNSFNELVEFGLATIVKNIINASPEVDLEAHTREFDEKKDAAVAIFENAKQEIEGLIRQLEKAPTLEDAKAIDEEIYAKIKSLEDNIDNGLEDAYTAFPDAAPESVEMDEAIYDDGKTSARPTVETPPARPSNPIPRSNSFIEDEGSETSQTISSSSTISTDKKYYGGSYQEALGNKIDDALNSIAKRVRENYNFDKDATVTLDNKKMKVQDALNQLFKGLIEIRDNLKPDNIRESAEKFNIQREKINKTINSWIDEGILQEDEEEV